MFIYTPDSRDSWSDSARSDELLLLYSSKPLLYLTTSSPIFDNFLRSDVRSILAVFFSISCFNGYSSELLTSMVTSLFSDLYCKGKSIVFPSLSLLPFTTSELLFSSDATFRGSLKFKDDAKLYYLIIF